MDALRTGYVLMCLCDQGRGWEPGQVKRKLQGLIDKYKDVPKKPAYTYSGPWIGTSLSMKMTVLTGSRAIAGHSRGT